MTLLLLLMMITISLLMLVITAFAPYIVGVVSADEATPPDSVAEMLRFGVDSEEQLERGKPWISEECNGQSRRAIRQDSPLVHSRRRASHSASARRR
eukprot:COSAG05_NODE_9480_length_621_cov_2.053640_1_plen_97_part_00